MNKDEQTNSNISNVHQSGSQNIVAGRDVHLAPPTPPRFTENKRLYTVIAGGSKMSLYRENLKLGPRSLFNANGMRPFAVHLSDDNKLVVDASLYAGPDRPAVLLVDNDLSHRPEGWDWNHDERAAEVVDETGAVVFHIEYQDDNTAVIKGRFVAGGMLMVCDDTGAWNINSISGLTSERTWPIKPAFKYPSKDHKGERVSP
jgi:hypothetical protein